MQRLASTSMQAAAKVRSAAASGRGTALGARTRCNASMSLQEPQLSGNRDAPMLSGSEIRMLGYARNQRRADIAAKELQEQCEKSFNKFHTTGLKTYRSFSSASANCEHFQTKLDAVLQAQDCPEAVRLAVFEAAKDTEREVLIESDAQVNDMKGYLYKMDMFDQDRQSDIAGFVFGAEFTAPKAQPKVIRQRKPQNNKGILWRKEIGMLEKSAGYQESDLNATMAMLESKACECAIRKTRGVPKESSESSPKDVADGTLTIDLGPDHCEGRDKWNMIIALLVDANLRVLSHRVTRFEGGQGLWSVKQLMTLAYYNARAGVWRSTSGTVIKDLPFFSRGWGNRLSPFLGD